MGADLITALAFKPSETELNKEAGIEVIKNLTADDLKNSWVAEATYMLEDYDDETEAVEAIRELLEEYLVEFCSYWTDFSRGCNLYTNVYNLGIDLLVVGDRSWGDSIPEVDVVCSITQIRKLAEALGLWLGND